MPFDRVSAAQICRITGPKDPALTTDDVGGNGESAAEAAEPHGSQLGHEERGGIGVFVLLTRLFVGSHDYIHQKTTCECHAHQKVFSC